MSKNFTSHSDIIRLIHELKVDVYGDLQEASEKSLKSKEPSFVHYLLHNKCINTYQFAYNAAEFFNIPFLDLQAYNPEYIPMDIIDERITNSYHCIPLYSNGKNLIIAIENPLYLGGIREYKFKLKDCQVEYVLVDYSLLIALIEKLNLMLSKQSLNNFYDDEINKLDFELSGDYDYDEHEADEDDAPIVKFINKVIMDAITKGASDIHFEPYPEYMRIRFRIDGMLKDMFLPPSNIRHRISLRLKVMAQLNISEKRVPQDGRFRLKISNKRQVDFRVSSLPTEFGEKIVLRILDNSASLMNIENIGMSPHQLRMYRRTLGLSQGMILVTGPTGSGKTVTLYSGLSVINTEDKNISTVENPVEIRVKNITQVQINNKQGLTFAAALRSFLRQDPDIIMIGEIRDLETAKIATQAAQTGHLVLSTLHTNSAIETIMRLVDIGVPSYHLATSLSLIIAQRLVRKVCPHCRVEHTPDEIELKALQKSSQYNNGVVIYCANSKGCDRCFHGYKGRTAIFEMLKVSREIARLVFNNASQYDLENQARLEGMIPLFDEAMVKVIEGITTFDEVNRVAIDYS